MAKTTFKSLLRDTIEVVRDSKVPVRSVDFDPRTKHLRVEFDREAAPTGSVPAVALQVGSPAAPDPAPPEQKFVPGTTIPDDNSPVNPLDLVASRPTYSLNGSG